MTRLADFYATPVRRRTLVVLIALAAFFAALLSAMFYLRWVSEEWPTPFHFASLLMVAALTMFAFSGSACCEVAARSTGQASQEVAVRWIAVAIASWLTFLFLEIVEWVRLVYLERLGPSTSFGATFLSLTGAHWIVAVVCVCWMTFAAADTRRRDVLAVAMFSHFLCLIWLVLVFTLYFSNANLQGI